MTDTVKPTGLYVRLGDAEVIRRGGWVLWSSQPAPGFERQGRNGYVRPIQPGNRWTATVSRIEAPIGRSGSTSIPAAKGG